MALTLEQNQHIVGTSIAAMASFDALLVSLQKNCSPEDFDIQRTAIAKVMGEISWEILNPIFVAHPELEPQTEEDWAIAAGLSAR